MTDHDEAKMDAMNEYSDEWIAQGNDEMKSRIIDLINERILSTMKSHCSFDELKRDTIIRDTLHTLKMEIEKL